MPKQFVSHDGYVKAGIERKKTILADADVEGFYPLQVGDLHPLMKEVYLWVSMSSRGAGPTAGGLSSLGDAIILQAADDYRPNSLVWVPY